MCSWCPSPWIPWVWTKDFLQPNISLCNWYYTHASRRHILQSKLVWGHLKHSSHGMWNDYNNSIPIVVSSMYKCQNWKMFLIPCVLVHGTTCICHYKISKPNGRQFSMCCTHCCKNEINVMWFHFVSQISTWQIPQLVLH